MRPLGWLVGMAVLAAPAFPLAAQQDTSLAETASVLKQLVETYGVSGHEAPVREAVQGLLPSWARTTTDTAGNLWLSVGEGDPVTVIVAHQDEIGWDVRDVRDDGTLDLHRQGGFFPLLFEAEPALVHTAKGDVPGIFMPRDSGFASAEPPALRVDLGTGSRAGTEALGVGPGASVTMPKRFVRLARHKATARSFDDRVGCTALVEAVRHLDRSKLRHRVVFLWSTREELGLFGARAAAAELGPHVARVYAIDTFVSADAPLEPANYAVAPLGLGPVARVVDNSSVTPPAYRDSLATLARARGIPLQIGTTSGGNDGSAFTPYGAVDIAIGWPLRYSHSPAEVIDLRDVVHLGDLVRAIAEDW